MRELENTIQRAVALLGGPRIELRDITLLDRLRGKATPAAAPEEGGAGTSLPPDGMDLEARLAEIEKAYLALALARTNGHLTKAAQVLRISLRSLRYKLAKYDMDA